MTSPLSQPFGAGRADVVLPEHFQQARTRLTGDDRR